jgi:outer membrane protein OmpA-like peptidoglycan-associated protein
MFGRARTFAIGLAGAAVLTTGCVTKSTFRREMNDRRTETRAERAERLAADSALDAKFTTELASLRQELQTLRTDFGAKITALETGMRFAFPVNFAFDDATVREEDRAALERFAAVAQKFYPGAVITVEGFADPAGSARYNLNLSRRRAENVRQLLVERGLSAESVRPVGYGETRLVVAGAERDEPGAEKNRRVVFVVESHGDATAPRPVAAGELSQTPPQR